MKGTLNVLLLICLGLTTASCSKGERARRMELQLEERIKNGLAIGASRAEVEGIVDKIEVDGVKLKRHEYSTDLSQLGTEPERPAKPRKNPDEVGGYVFTETDTIDSDYTVMYNVGLHVVFYFDRDQRLSEYQVYRYYRH